MALNGTYQHKAKRSAETIKNLPQVVSGQQTLSVRLPRAFRAHCGKKPWRDALRLEASVRPGQPRDESQTQDPILTDYRLEITELYEALASRSRL